MHRSRLQSVVIDCEDLEKAERFWSETLGVGIQGKDDTYALLEPVNRELRILLQRVPEGKTVKSRVHLDIESDDIEAEAQRLERLGAQRVGLVEKWWVMLDPCGNEFCVVPARSPWFAEGAKEWPD